MTSLYRKYRPQTFSDVIGQTHIVQTLSNAITNNRIGHAYLFTGPRGTGKTTMARIFARAINCQNSKGANPCMECEVCRNITEGRSLDIFEIDAASNTGVDNIRELRENVKFPPSHAKYKVYIIDEVHMLSTGAFNALLKTLEEPPTHAVFILATTEIHKVPETILSRCQRYDFTRLSLEHIIEKLGVIAKSEGVAIEQSALEMIAIAAEGGMRDGESLLSQVMSLEDKNITTKEVEEILGTTKRQSLEALTKYLLEKKTAEAITLINELSQEGYDLEVFNKSMLNFLRQVMLLSVDEKLAKIFAYELTSEQAKDLSSLAKNQDPKKLLFIIGCFGEIQGKIKSAFIPQLPLEMAIIKAVGGSENQPAAPQQASSQAKLTASAAPTNQPARPTVNEPKPAQAQPEPPKAPQEPKIAAVDPFAPASFQTAHIEKKVEISQKVEESNPQEEPLEGPLEPGEFTISDVKRHWNEAALATKALNHSLSAVLQNCQPVSVEGNFITIATKFAFYKDKLNEQSNALTLEGIFAKILGSAARIKIVTAEEAGVTIASTLTQNNAQAAEPTPSETSSLLADAMGIIGGQIVE